MEMPELRERFIEQEKYRRDRRIAKGLAFVCLTAQLIGLTVICVNIIMPSAETLGGYLFLIGFIAILVTGKRQGRRIVKRLMQNSNQKGPAGHSPD